MSADLLAKPGIRRLIQATAKVYEQALDSPSISYEIPSEMRQKLEEDIFVFSGFKTYHQLKEASLLLRDDAGNIKPFSKFYQDVSKIKEKYNRNWLRAEYNFATASAEMASHWAEYATHKEYTNLQYHTALDDKVRESHAALEGITLPYEDSFWNTAFPPNGWNCRCHVVPVLKEDYPVSDSQTAQQSFEMLTEGSEIFRFNPGKEAVIFPPHHPYYGKRGYKHCLNPHLALSFDDDPSDPCGVYRKIKEAEEEKKYVTYKNEDGTQIKVHKDADPIELEDNIRTGLVIAKAFPQRDIRVREHIREKGKKNAEYEIDGELGDAKRVLSEEGITAGFKKAIKQKAKVVIIDFDKHCANRVISFRKVSQKIAWRRQDFDDGTIEYVYVVHNQKVIEIGRKDCTRERISSLLKEKGL